ncbi:MAG: hypothetical protein ACRCWO_01825 [Bosea sp. (in: a-proteobacteria)]
MLRGLRPSLLCKLALALAAGLSLLTTPAVADTERHPNARNAPVRSSNPAETRIIPYAGNLPACSSADVISHVTSQFGWREWEYWNSNLTIAAVDRVGEIGYRTWGRDFIPRRYCSARVLLSNQRYAKVDYAVRDRLGLFMMGWDVSWCVTGLDRHKSYAPECRMARP